MGKRRRGGGRIMDIELVPLYPRNWAMEMFLRFARFASFLKKKEKECQERLDDWDHHVEYLKRNGWEEKVK